MQMKKVLSIILVAVMLLSVIPLSASATTWLNPYASDLEAGDIIASGSERIHELEGYTLTLQAGGYGQEWPEEAENSDLVTTDFDFDYSGEPGTVFAIVDFSDGFTSYLPYYENGITNQWVVVAINQNEQTITLSGGSASSSSDTELNEQTIMSLLDEMFVLVNTLQEQGNDAAASAVSEAQYALGYTYFEVAQQTITPDVVSAYNNALAVYEQYSGSGGQGSGNTPIEEPEVNTIYYTDIVHLSELSAGDVVLKGVGALETDNCTIVLYGGRYGEGDANFGQLDNVCPSSRTLGEPHIDFDIMQFVDESNFGRYVPVDANGNIANAFIVMAKNGNTLTLAGINAYKITWKDGNNSTLSTEGYVAGATPSYNGATPTKTSTAQYNYSFNNTWSPAITAVTEDATYTAQFNQTTRNYTITWKSDASTVIDTTQVAYGATPTHAAAAGYEDAENTYTFAAWSPEVAAVTGNATYTATYTATPKATPVAEVNGTNYATLAEAIAAAGTGATVTLLDDVTVDSPVVVAAGKDIKLDLNGHSLSGNIADADGKKLIQVSGKLEFVGENGGCIYNTNVAGQGHAACQALTGGTVIVNAPIYFGDSDTDMTNANAVNRGCGIQNNGGTLIINDGYYTSIDANYSTGAWAYAILNCAGDTTVNNATVYGVGLHGALGCEEGTFTVNGGTFAVNGANNYYSLYCDGGDFTVNGGTFTNNGKYGVNYVGTGSSTTITGGDFTYSAKTPFVQSSSVSNPVVSGGSFSTLIPAEYCADGFAPVTTPNAQGLYEVGHPNDGVNITVTDSISDNFYLDEDFYGEDAVVVVNYNNQSNASETASFITETIEIDDMQKYDNPGDSHHGDPMFSIIQAPAQATEPIQIAVYANAEDAAAGKNPVRTIEYNTYSYCRAIIESGDDDGLKELAESTLDYCAAAQTYFGYNTGNMATKDNGGAYYNDISSADFSGVASLVKPSCIKKVTMVAKSDLEINLLSLTPITVTGSSMDAESGKTRFSVSDSVNGDYYEVNIKGIVPANMNKTITIYTSAGEIVLTANTIMKIMANSSKTDLANMAKALYLYGAAAYNYFG